MGRSWHWGKNPGEAAVHIRESMLGNWKKWFENTDKHAKKAVEQHETWRAGEGPMWRCYANPQSSCQFQPRSLKHEHMRAKYRNSNDHELLAANSKPPACS